MKIIDKRKESKDEEWQLGDVIYFESYDQHIKDFGIIATKENCPKCGGKL